MHLLIGCIALASFAIISLIAEGKPQTHNTLKSNNNKRSLGRR